MSDWIGKIAAKNTMRVAGLMSGTSVDGVDVAVVDITKQKVDLLAFDVFPYPNALRREILHLCSLETALLDNICHYNFVLGEVFADGIINIS
jgi:anhydro-N-acetylmuramic acid kinase